MIKTDSINTMFKVNEWRFAHLRGSGVATDVLRNPICCAMQKT